MIPDYPPSTAIPTFAQFWWLLATVRATAEGVQRIMSELTDLRAQALGLQQKVDQLAAAEGAQSAAITGLAGTVDQLIQLVGQLRQGLSPEEKAVADEAMAAIAKTLSSVDTASAGSLSQSQQISDLAARASAAVNPTPPPAA